jgi:hypothetical protein
LGKGILCGAAEVAFSAVDATLLGEEGFGSAHQDFWGKSRSAQKVFNKGTVRFNGPHEEVRRIDGLMAQFSSALLRCLKGGLGFYGKVVHTFSMAQSTCPRG